MKYPVIIVYIAISALVIYFFAKPSFKLVSECCKSEYRELPKKDRYAMMCLNCKKWCDLIEVKETK